MNSLSVHNAILNVPQPEQKGKILDLICKEFNIGDENIIDNLSKFVPK